MKVSLAFFVTLTIVLNFSLPDTTVAGIFNVSFKASVSEASGLVASYGLYYQPFSHTIQTNWIYLGQCPSGQTNISADTSALLSNPVYFVVAARGINGAGSTNSLPYLYYTNTTSFLAFAIPGEGVSTLSTNHKAALPKIASILALGDGSVQLHGIVSAGSPTNQVYTVVACTNLTAAVWLPIGTTTANGTNLDFVDPTAGNFPSRYYRFSK